MINLECMKNNKYWSMENNQLNEYIDILKNEAETWDVVDSGNNRYAKYINIPCAFDTETSSFYYEDDNDKTSRKGACMYIWIFSINGYVMIGRTYEALGEFLDKVYDTFIDCQESDLAFVVYVHNLAYDFQFIRKWINWRNVFASKPRRPIYASADGFEFRCSYFLSGMSLAATAKNLVKYKFEKKIGDLDYNLLRHSNTPLTEAEMGYCLHDVYVVTAYIQEKIEQDGSVANIPLTNTGYVRRYCRNACFELTNSNASEEEKKRKRMNYHELMKSLQINNEDEYKQLRRAFMGGYTHCSAMWSRKTITSEKSTFKGDYYAEGGIGSIDITSSYPYVMVSKYFPMSRFRYIGSPDTNEAFYNYLKYYCCIFDVEFHNLRPKVNYENPLSLSKCTVEGQCIVNNGRIAKATQVKTTLTELDWITILHFYVWDEIIVTNMRIADRGRLPRDLILAVLHFYKGKTELKDVVGKELEYLLLKGMLNAVFGMAVTNIIRDEQIYELDEEEWIKNEADIDKQLSKYNNSFTRFLSYAWGVWVTAHARRRLFEGIEEFGKDYVYTDTDSIKCINLAKHMTWIKKENLKVKNTLLEASIDLKFPFGNAAPKNKKGVNKLMGEWEIEEGYFTFKSIGAKRYIYELTAKDSNGHILYDEDGNAKIDISFTASGLNKKQAIPWLLDKYKTHANVFFYFDDGLYVEAGHTGCMTHTYIDYETSGKLVDYLGNEGDWNELSCVHMENQSYYLSLAWSYQQYVAGVQEVEE